MPTYRAEGITLLARKYKGTGRVVVYFTRERGKVEAVAQGVGKPGSTLAPAVELFAHSQLFLAEGRELDRLTQARVIESFERLRRDVLRMGYAGVVCELYAVATERGEAIPEAFDDLRTFLAELDAGGPVKPLAAAVMWRFLSRSGVAPQLDDCVRCGRDLRPDEIGHVIPGEGGVACSGCRSGAQAESLLVEPRLRALAAGLARLDVGRAHRVAAAEGDWSRLIQIIMLQITFHLGLSLKSAEFVRQLEKQSLG
ncbi:MAG: DNA repair protein RecO [Armatimonadetes bacterium]|nr:DNA repair protein RecO [Armatimonadota bacterium]